MARVPKWLFNAWPILASGLLYVGAFPPTNLGLLVFIALVPWFCSLAPQEGVLRRGFRSGYLLGVIIVGHQMAFTFKLTQQWTGSTWLGLAPWLVCIFLGSFYFAFLGSLAQRAMAKGWWFAIPLFWAGMEIFRTYIPGLAFPFFILATPLWPYPVLIQDAFLGTIYMVSGWVCLVNLVVVMYLLKTPLKTARPYVIAGLVLLIASLFRFIQPLSGSPKRIVAGQPAVDVAYMEGASKERSLFANVGYLYSEAQRVKADLLVLPEGLAEGGEVMPPRTPFLVQASPPVIFGGHRTLLRGSIPSTGPTEAKVYQSAYAYDGKWQFADKARLVVFGEYVPFRNYLPFLDNFKLPNGDLTPADTTRTLTVNGLRVGPLICFEGMFWDVAYKHVLNDAQVLTMMSIDDWYMGTAAPDQLRTAAVWRAVECDLPVARAASLGYSLTVDQRGRVLNEAALGKPKALATTLYLPDHVSQMPVRPILVWLFGLSLPTFMVLLYGEDLRRRWKGRAKK